MIKSFTDYITAMTIQGDYDSSYEFKRAIAVLNSAIKLIDLESTFKSKLVKLTNNLYIITLNNKEEIQFEWRNESVHNIKLIRNKNNEITQSNTSR
jgi:hypothetical protein